MLITVAYPRQNAAVDLRTFTPIDEDGLWGFDALLPTGERVAYRVTIDKKRGIALEDIEMRGESLLLVTAADGQRRGVVLGAENLRIAGFPQFLGTGDAEFVENPRGEVSLSPIHRPLAPVRILPGTDLFADTQDVRLTCPTPGAQIHYTLDGSEPAPTSSLYTNPLTLKESTVVRARAFRPGISQVPPTLTGIDATAASRAVFTRRPALVPGHPLPCLWHLVDRPRKRPAPAGDPLPRLPGRQRGSLLPQRGVRLRVGRRQTRTIDQCPGPRKTAHSLRMAPPEPVMSDS